MSRLRTLAVTASLAAALTVPAGGAAQAASPLQPGFAARTDSLVNAQRTGHDLRALRSSACLTRSAQRQAQRMADRGELFHQDLGAVLRSCGLSAAGENVAYGYPTPRRTVRGWMGSDGHRANILNRTYRVAGVGAVRKKGRWYVAQVFGRAS